MPPKTKAKLCDCCCDPINEKEHECLKCEGVCGIVAHRYCMGVTRKHFKAIKKQKMTFVYQYCALSLNGAVIQQLQSEITALKSEPASVKQALEEAETTITSIQKRRTSPS